MLNTIVFVIVVIAVGLAISSAVAMRRRHTTTEGRPWSDDELSPAIRNFLAAFHSSQHESDEQFVRALENLRFDAVGCSQRIVSAFDKLDELQFGARRSLLYTARYLRHESALPFLLHIAQQEPSGQPSHEGSKLAEESMLRSIAVEGIEQIARQGNKGALDGLMALIASTDRLVQASSVVALKYMNVPPEQLRSVVPKDRLYLMDIVRVDIQDVTQVRDPRRHLRSESVRSRDRPSLDVMTGAASAAVNPNTRVPNVRQERKDG